MRNVVDEYLWTDSKQILTHRETQIPQLVTFGHDISRQASMTMTPHCHVNKFEIVVAISGQQKYVADGEPYTISGGEAFTTFPGEPHSGREETENVGEIYWFQIDVKSGENFFHLTPPWSEQLYHRLLRINARVCRVPTEAIRLMKKSFRLLSSGNSFDKLNGGAAFTSFLSDFITSNLTESTAAPSPAIQKVMAYIGENLEQEIRLEQLARLCGLSLCGFKLKFKAETGVAPREYINLQKIEEAKRRMGADPAASISDIAMSLGFSSSNYFSVVFRKYTGIPPRQYLRHIQRE